MWYGTYNSEVNLIHTFVFRYPIHSKNHGGSHLMLIKKLYSKWHINKGENFAHNGFHRFSNQRLVLKLNALCKIVLNQSVTHNAKDEGFGTMSTDWTTRPPHNFEREKKKNCKAKLKKIKAKIKQKRVVIVTFVSPMLNSFFY